MTHTNSKAGTKRAFGLVVCVAVALLVVGWLTQSGGAAHGIGLPGSQPHAAPIEDEVQLAALPAHGARSAPLVSAVGPTLVESPGAAGSAVETDEPEVDVRVKVVDHAGRVLKRVKVGIARPGRWGSHTHYRAKRTNSRGEALFRRFPSGPFWAEVQQKSLPPEYIACTRTTSNADGPSVETLVLTCPMPGVLEGRITRPDGTPLSAGTVRIKAIEHDAQSIQVKPDAEGQFSASRLQPGRWQVDLEASDADAFSGLSVPAAQEVLVQAGLTHDVELRCPSEGYWISGQVLDQEAAPVEGVLVRAGRFRRYQDDGLITKIIGKGYAFAKTNEAGSYRLGPLARKEYMVQVGAPRSPQGVTSDPVLLAATPPGFLARAGDERVHSSIVECATDRLQWHVTPVVDEGLLRKTFLVEPDSTLADWTAQVDQHRLTLNKDGAWTFSTPRDLSALSIELKNDAEAGKSLNVAWNIKLSTLSKNGGTITLPFPPPPDLR